MNAITDVAGVRVGHVTLIEGETVRTGVTAILPHGGNLYQDKVPAGFAVGNGFGKFTGSTQVVELGEIETPILLTNTFSVPEAVRGIVDWTLAQPGNEEVRSVNAVVGETNDGFLNDIRARRVTRAHVRAAIEAAREGPVAGGRGRRRDGDDRLRLEGRHRHRLAPPARGARRLDRRRAGPDQLRRRAHRRRRARRRGARPALSARELQRAAGDGSVIIVIATDAPLSDRNLSDSLGAPSSASAAPARR